MHGPFLQGTIVTQLKGVIDILCKTLWDIK